MALLTREQREVRLKFLGFGEYNVTNIKKFQKHAFPTMPSQWDGKYGVNTDRALRHFYNVKKYTKNFEPEEFKCECGGRYCTGYPSYMKKVELQNLQAIRDHYKKPMKVTCGLRCPVYNRKLSGSIPNSKHLYGYACDFNMDGVTESIAQRKAAIKWIKKLPNHNYTYGHGYNSYGVSISAPYMGYGNGAAIHTDTNAPKVTTSSPSVSGGKSKSSSKKTVQEKMVAFAEKIAADNSYIYVHWKKDDPKTKQCPICHKFPKGKYHGFYCTRWVYSVWKHGGGLPIDCDKAPNNGAIEKIYNAKTNAEALKLARKYFRIQDIQVIRSKKGIAQKALKPGDACYYFKGSICQHAFVYIGKGKMIDANSLKDGIAKRKAMSCKVAVRFIGTNSENAKLMKACAEQAIHMKNYAYGWESLPTVAKSKKKGTCVTFVACVLQRLGILKPGQYIWHDGKGNVTHLNDNMYVVHPKAKTVKAYKPYLRAGDILIVGNKNDVGSGSHICIATGKWDGNNPYVWDNHCAENIKEGKARAHTYNGNKGLIAVIRLK